MTKLLKLAAYKPVAIYVSLVLRNVTEYSHCSHKSLRALVPWGGYFEATVAKWTSLLRVVVLSSQVHPTFKTSLRQTSNFCKLFNHIITYIHTFCYRLKYCIQMKQFLLISSMSLIYLNIQLDCIKSIHMVNWLWNISKVTHFAFFDVSTLLYVRSNN